MASSAVHFQPQTFACKCLNVRLRTAPTESAAPEPSNDAGFLKIHVGEDGIQVAHPQLTLRVKSRGESIPGTARWSRFTTLTCLVCDLAVYRVHQVISSEVEAKDLPLLPSDDWAEQEIMKSPNGWIEVSKDCLSGEAIAQTASSKEYSSLFSLVLPPPPEATPTSPTTWLSPESTASSTPTPTIPESYLSHLPPLLPPPPFTPSHPAFIHILSVAERDSQNIRTAANQELVKIVRAKAAEVEEKEAELKAQLERLWLKFKHGQEKIQLERPHVAPSSASWPTPARTSDHRSNGVKAPVAIPGFNPVSISVPPQITPPPPPRKSWLSQSLAGTSSIHEAMGNRSAHGTSASEGASMRSSPTLVPHSMNEREITSVLQFGRKVDDSINTAVSYRYFLNMDEEMRRHKNERASEAAPDHDEAMGMPGPSRPTTNGRDSQPSATTSGTDGDTKGKEKEEKGKKETKAKNKHVHFNDVQPSTKETTREPASRKSQGSAKPDSGEMVFDIDDDVAGAEAQPGEVQASLPLLDPPAAHQRARRTKPQNNAGLPASFSTLRPASLPAPSHMRSATPPNRDAYANNILSSLPRPSGPASKEINGENKEKDDTTDQDTSEDTTDSSPRPTSDSDSDSDDYGEEYHHHSRYGIPGSLPVNIVSRVRPREVLSLASYQQKPNVERPQQAGAPTAPTGGAAGQPSKKTSASAVRKATYAERDRSRFLDPGNLDFVAEEDEEEEEDQMARKAVAQSVDGELGRTYAFRILQARAELPEEGMWRSLAS
ncbi:hypothetical protein NP233_g2269 [Leucocoprinus birnbaumii]|uniref:Uncharacterized protein n=1 Tax=Leucocoprinus birnbaumii TaxID=56174 RepID=A0AAD5YV21_9AGAR|nr:hypothetical protein NP233_g2269 [Leucocoprinus birnbaumii]